MHSDLDELLCSRYPEIFRRRRDVGSCMAWGFACGDGWFELLDGLCREITEAVKAGAPAVVAEHVKEEFGRLVLQVEGGNEAVLDLIREAASRSARTCELCGQPGSISDLDGYLRCRCPAHDAEDRRQTAEALEAARRRRAEEPGVGEKLCARLRGGKFAVLVKSADYFGMAPLRQAWEEVKGGLPDDQVRKVKEILDAIEKDLDTLENLAKKSFDSTSRASAAIDDAVTSIEVSNARIEALERARGKGRKEQ